METNLPRFEAMNVGSLLDRAFRLYRQNFSLMLGIVAVTIVPFTMLQVILAFLKGAMPSQDPLVAVGNLLVLLLLGLVAYPIAQGAATFAISERYLGQQITIGHALRYATSRLVTLINTTLSVGMRVGLGMLFFVVPGVIWMCMYAIAVPIVIAEGIKTREGLRRSRELTKGLKGKIFLVLIVVSTISFVLSAGTASLLSIFFDTNKALGEMMLQTVSGVSTIVVTPLGVIAATLLYYDARIRKEGFDLEMLGHAFAPPSQRSDTPSASTSKADDRTE